MTTEIEPKIISILSGLDTLFGEGAVANSTFSVLDRGIAPFNYAVLMPMDPAPSSGGASRRIFIDWNYTLMLFVRYTNDADTTATLSQLVKETILQLYRYPTLGTLADMRHSEIVVGGGAVEPVFDKDGNGPFFYRKDLKLRYTREYPITGGEYA